MYLQVRLETNGIYFCKISKNDNTNRLFSFRDAKIGMGKFDNFCPISLHEIFLGNLQIILKFTSFFLYSEPLF
jgi:hypothetical protein